MIWDAIPPEMFAMTTLPGSIEGLLLLERSGIIPRRPHQAVAVIMMITGEDSHPCLTEIVIHHLHRPRSEGATHQTPLAVVMADHLLCPRLLRLMIDTTGGHMNGMLPIPRHI